MGSKATTVWKLHWGPLASSPPPFHPGFCPSTDVLASWKLLNRSKEGRKSLLYLGKATASIQLFVFENVAVMLCWFYYLLAEALQAKSAIQEQVELS